MKIKLLPVIQTRATNLSLICGVAFLAFGNPAQAITIRDDRIDSQYTTLADNSYPYGGIILGNGFYGSATLISPNWVLTAGHCLSGSVQFISSVGATTISQQIIYPGLDIGLARLSTPITTIQPVSLYSLAYGVEDGQAAVFMGAGNTGTGITGQIDGSGYDCRAAQTYVYANAAAWGWGSDRLLTWFRAPGSGAANLEGGSAQGDSGGGLLLNVNGQDALAGVDSLVWSGGDGGSVIGQYNTGGAYVRSAPLNDWILSYATDATIVPEPVTGILLGLASLGLAARRRHRTG